MPAAYLILVFHTVILTPASYCTQPVGLLLAGVMLLGTLACMTTFGAAIGKKRQAYGNILSLSEKGSGITEVVCEMGPFWPGHQAGQFAFVTFVKQEGSHPFTIASASETSLSRVVFQIKALGDYTKALGTKLASGQSVMIEGPYGRFTLDHASSDSPQLWVAGGIGITPFLS
jgi:predicted ferric reductase